MFIDVVLCCVVYDDICMVCVVGIVVGEIVFCECVLFVSVFDVAAVEDYLKLLVLFWMC